MYAVGMKQSCEKTAWCLCVCCGELHADHNNNNKMQNQFLFDLILAASEGY